MEFGTTGQAVEYREIRQLIVKAGKFGREVVGRYHEIIGLLDAAENINNKLNSNT